MGWALVLVALELREERGEREDVLLSLASAGVGVCKSVEEGLGAEPAEGVGACDCVAEGEEEREGEGEREREGKGERVALAE